MKDTLKNILNSNFTKYWLPVFLWAGFIYILSSQPSLKSSLEPILDMIFRKLVHITEFGIFAFLMSRAFNFYEIKGWKLWLPILLISFAYAVSDEVHQSFVQGRYGTIRDMLIDFNGAFLGVIGWHLNQLKKKKKRRI